MRRYLRLLAVLIPGLVVVPAVATTSGTKLDAALAQLPAPGKALGQVSVIVRTTSAPTRTNLDEFASLGGRYRCTFRSFPGFAGTVPVGRLSDLASRRWVKGVSSDARVRKMLDVTAPAIGADVAWSTLELTGRGVTIAVLDSGITEHGDFVNPPVSGDDWKKCPSRVIGGADWTKDKVEGRFKDNDKCGHGTDVAGIIAGNGLMTVWYKGHDPKDDPQFYRHFVGIAPEAALVNCRVLDKEGFGYVSDVVAAIEWCVENAALYNIEVINLSLGHPIAESYTTDPLCQACEYAWTHGIVVVVAAGNWGRAGYSSILSPANDPYVITVGATNTYGTPDRSDDHICAYSGRGPTAIDHILKPDLVAPGNRIVSARDRDSFLDKLFKDTNVVPTDSYEGRPHGNPRDESAYFVLSGTSMSAAVVSGAAALMLQQDPTLTPDTVKTRLMLTAEKWPSYGPLWQGAGYLSVPAALSSTVQSLTPAASPPVVATDDGGVAIDPQPGAVDANNIVWDPRTSPGTRAAGMYASEPVSEVYQPARDPFWTSWQPYPWWPEWACTAGLSDVDIFGEDYPSYVGKHGPKPPKN